MAFVRGTVYTSGVSLVMAMSMKQTFIAHFFSSSLAFRSNMVNFQEIVIFEVQSTPSACPCLFLQEFAFDATQQVMFAEPLTPVDQVSVIWAGRSLDFDMTLNMGLWVVPQGGFSIREGPTFSFIHMPIGIGYPTLAFVWVSESCPVLQLEKQDIFTVIKHLGCCHRSVISRPSSNLCIQLSNELSLRSITVFSYHLSEFCDVSFHRFFTGPDEGFEAKWRTIVSSFSCMGFSRWELPDRPS
jgi:hypothetical protein